MWDLKKKTHVWASSTCWGGVTLRSQISLQAQSQRSLYFGLGPETSSLKEDFYTLAGPQQNVTTE